MGNAISACFKKYATFSGRASRSEYWFFYLFYIISLFFLFRNFAQKTYSKKPSDKASDKKTDTKKAQ
jgi:uncharacterized membrane protein YhaH (DUF805 family)